MKPILFTLFFLCFLFQTQAQVQNNQVEIYIVHNDSILQGTIVSSTTDSITLQLDSVSYISFAKNEMEGKDLAVSQEVKKLRKRLIKETYNVKSPFADFPGSYQIKYSQKTKGYIMAGIATVGIASAVIVTPVWVAVNGLKGLVLLFGTTAGVLGALAIYGTAVFWSKIDQYYTIKKLINNRYYYTGTKY